MGFYDLKAVSNDGSEVDFKTFEGKTILLVNTASKCGLTPQYKGLEELFQKYKDKNFLILGFPSGSFAGQEFKTDKETKEFCDLNFKISFPLFSKVSVLGPNKHPVYKYLTKEQPNKKTRVTPKWNFAKFLIDKNGQVVHYFGSRTDPLAPEVVEAIESIL